MRTATTFRPRGSKSRTACKSSGQSPTKWLTKSVAKQDHQREIDESEKAIQIALQFAIDSLFAEQSLSSSSKERLAGSAESAAAATGASAAAGGGEPIASTSAMREGRQRAAMPSPQSVAASAPCANVSNETPSSVGHSSARHVS